MVNQVVYVYTAWGLLAREYQEHEGAVDQDTLYVEYAYAGAEDGLRLDAKQGGRLVQAVFAKSVMLLHHEVNEADS